MKRTQQYLSILLSYMLIFMPLHAASVQTDGNTQTTLETARNGVEVVNIANPNSNGLSHNTFSTYNVETQGLILNNSKDTSVNTQLGGYIYGNTQLTNNAKVILNEVTSTNRTYMNGYTEVAGQRADLVIANPNGITVNGAGFINTSNVTLTTGAPNIFNGILDAFNIAGGDISIEGKGLDVTCQDSANIYTHFLKINAAIHAKELDIKLGQNVIDAQTKPLQTMERSPCKILQRKATLLFTPMKILLPLEI
jgi:filamentous hemagglutinin